MKKILAGVILFSITGYAGAQNVVPCHTDEVYVESVKKFPEVKLQEDMATKIALNSPAYHKKGTIKYIPVVFHVLHKYGLENISQAQLNDAIRILNEDFRKASGTNGGTSTDPLSTDMEYEFRLAQYDPNGQPTNGVNRIYTTGTDDARDAQKALSYWDARKYFNVWVVNTIQNTTGDPNSIVLGYAQFPFQLNSQTSTDGVIVRADQVGIIEVADVSQAGRTLSHESGHWVGLYHPFQGGCVGNTAATCGSQGDQVCDTPPVSTSTSGCPSSRNSCTNDVPDNNDLVKNYMDYADGNCMNMFTVGQKARVDVMMPNYRSNIYSSTNLSAAGLNADGTYKTMAAASLKGPYSYGFNTTSLAGTGWTIENYMSPGDSGWAVNNSLGANGSSGCMTALNLKNNRTNIRNAFVSPNIDISGMTTPTLTFYVAYAKRLSVSGDKLKIFISNNYGRTEVLEKTIAAAEMLTGGILTTSYTPAAGDWKKFSIDLSAYKSYTNFRVRIELQSLKGNNIYVDEFSVAEPTGLSETLHNQIQFSMYPNPANENCKLTYTLKTDEKVQLTITDIQGKELYQTPLEIQSKGDRDMSFDLTGYKSGLYLVRVQVGESYFVEKLLVN